MEQKKLIQFRNIVKDFDGQIVLKGINLDIMKMSLSRCLDQAAAARRRCYASWAVFWTQMRARSSLTDRISPRCRRISGS